MDHSMKQGTYKYADLMCLELHRLPCLTFMEIYINDQVEKLIAGPCLHVALWSEGIYLKTFTERARNTYKVLSEM